MRGARHLPNDHLAVDQARRRDFSLFVEEHELESLRQAIRRELRVHGGQEGLAREIGVSRGTLRKLIGMNSIPTQTNLERIREWTEHRPRVRVHQGAVCLALLVKFLPAEVRAAARLRLARELSSAYVEADSPVPVWLTAECARTS